MHMYIFVGIELSLISFLPLDVKIVRPSQSKIVSTQSPSHSQCLLKDGWVVTSRALQLCEHKIESGSVREL